MIFFRLLSRNRKRPAPSLLSLTAAVLIFILPFHPAKTAAGQNHPFDLLIKGGRVYDGSRGKPFTADIGIRGDRIVFIGKANKSRLGAVRVINAHGLIVSPGFIDPHTHTLEDLSDDKRKSNLNYLMQGVTTVITGNDGVSPFPLASTLDLWEKMGIGTNAALLVGHGTIRERVLGSNNIQPSAEQFDQMKRMVTQAMDEGAFGLSTGLYYVPGVYAKTDEVIELARAAAQRGGVYDTHMRDEDSYSVGLLDAIRETIRIGSAARIPVHISHIKALGPGVWGKSVEAIRLIKEARSRGINVTANQYPYGASGIDIKGALVPAWAQEGGDAELLKRMDDEGQKARLLVEMEKNLQRRGGAGRLLITSFKPDPQIVGKTLDTVAAQWKKTPVEAALDILRQGGANLASFNMSDEDIENFMKQDFVMTGSDGSSGHPRKYGTFPRKLREYVFNKKLISLSFAIRASSSLTAETFHIRERGRLKVGYFADVIVFDASAFTDHATYEQPEQLATGVSYVVINGQVVVDRGLYTGVLAGRPLRRK